MTRAADRSAQAQAHLDQANTFKGLGRYAEAVNSYRQAIKCRPDVAEIHNNLGNLLQALGQLPDAVASYHRALTLNPRLPNAHTNLGAAQLSLGQAEEAMASQRRALEVAPEFPEAHNNLGNALRQLGRLDEAAASYGRALEIKPDYAQAHNNLGNVLRDLGRAHDAVASYRRALEIAPALLEARNNLANTLQELGNAQLERGQPAEAADSYREALAITPDSPELHNNLGSALQSLGRLDEAAAGYRRALELKADFAKAHSNLGGVLRSQGRRFEAEASCHSALALEPDSAATLVLLAELRADQGQFDEARALLERAIAIEPQSPQAWAGLARWRTMTPADTAWLAHAQQIADSGLPPHQEALLRFSIGKYFADLKAFDRAFASYQRANELEKLHQGKHDRDSLTKTVDLLIDRYDREWLARAQSAALDSELPVFIVGMPRSGTTLAEQILASHPAVFGAGELPFWQTTVGTHELAVLHADAGHNTLRRLAHDYLQLLQALSPDALRVTDKMPGNFTFLGLVRAILPRARIIHMQRDPIDTCLSIYFQHFEAAAAYTNDLEDLAHYYTEYARLMSHWRAILPADAMLEVPYEELVADQEVWSRRLLEFVGLPWDARCLDFHRTERTVLTASNWQVRQKMSTGSVGRWRGYADFLGPLRRLTTL